MKTGGNLVFSSRLDQDVIGIQAFICPALRQRQSASALHGHDFLISHKIKVRVVHCQLPFISDTDGKIPGV